MPWWNRPVARAPRAPSGGGYLSTNPAALPPHVRAIFENAGQIGTGTQQTGFGMNPPPAAQPGPYWNPAPQQTPYPSAPMQAPQPLKPPKSVLPYRASYAPLRQFIDLYKRRTP